MGEKQMPLQEWVEPEPWVEVFSTGARPFGRGPASMGSGVLEPSVDESYLVALEGRAASVRAVARWFRTDHLPSEALHGDVAREFQVFTLRLLEMVGDDSVEMTEALRKLLEAKDAAVRAALS